jgi:hypothetical protein
MPGRSWPLQPIAQVPRHHELSLGHDVMPDIRHEALGVRLGQLPDHLGYAIRGAPLLWLPLVRRRTTIRSSLSQRPLPQATSSVPCGGQRLITAQIWPQSPKIVHPSSCADTDSAPFMSHQPGRLLPPSPTVLLRLSLMLTRLRPFHLGLAGLHKPRCTPALLLYFLDTLL